MSLLPVEDAIARLLSSAQPVVGTEEVSLSDANGRVLADAVAARLTQPPFNASAMDGYAFRYADLEGGDPLKVVGESAAGHAFDGIVNKGEAVRIFTGAPVPEGADTVLLQEDAERDADGRLVAKFHPPKGRHIRPRGQDFAENDMILPAGSLLDPSRIMVAAAMNHATLEVYRKPRVAVLATGDELIAPGGTLAPDQIIASNSFAIGALAREAGADVIDLGIVADDMDALNAVIERVKSLEIDLFVTLGGASVGDHDLVQTALKNAGMTLDFWRLAMRPGKPLMAGQLDDISVLGLPGNPVSSLVCALLFMQPMLRKMAHMPQMSREQKVVVSRDLAENDKRRDHLRAKLSRNDDGVLIAEPFEKQDSSMMNILAQSGCLIIRAPFAPPLKAGEMATAIILRVPDMA